MATTDTETRIAQLRNLTSGKPTRVTVPVTELRADLPETDDKNLTISGHAAVFDRLSEDLGGFREKVQRGAFRKALDEDQDVRLLINHQAYPVLARTKSKTLDLTEDVRGLAVHADVAPTQDARDLRTMMQRGDIDQMSFGFFVKSDVWEERDGDIIRTIIEIDELFDVSVVTFPAYPQTDASARVAETIAATQRMITTDTDNDPDAEAPDEQLAPPGDLGESGPDAEVTGTSATDERTAVRVRRSLAGRILERATGS